MTCANTAAPNAAGAEDRATTCTKAMLFCADCGFQAPWDGPWKVRAGDGYRDVYCPDCGTRVA